MYNDYVEEHLNGVMYLASLLMDEGEDPATLYMETQVEPVEALKQAEGIGEGRVEMQKIDPMKFINHICFYHKLAMKMKLYPLTKFIEARMRTHYKFNLEKCPSPDLRESVYDIHYLENTIKE